MLQEHLASQHGMDDELICPLTLDIFKDPVMCLDGHTYERAAIADWLRRNGTSPKTNAPLADDRLIPNYQVRQLAETRRKQDGIPAEPKLTLTSKQELDGRLTDLMLALYYPPASDLLKNASPAQIKAIWQAQARPPARPPARTHVHMCTRATEALPAEVLGPILYQIWAARSLTAQPHRPAARGHS